MLCRRSCLVPRERPPGPSHTHPPRGFFSTTAYTERSLIAWHFGILFPPDRSYQLHSDVLLSSRRLLNEQV